MGQTKLWVVCAVAAVAGMASAGRADIVRVGSTFSVQLYDNGAVSPGSPAAITFNGVAQTFAGFTAGQLVTVTESQTDLGSGNWEIDVHLTSDSEMFPAGLGSAGDNFAALNVGGGTPLQLTQAFDVTSIVLSAFGPNINFPINHNFEPDLTNLTPWDGTFPSTSQVAGFLPADGIGIQTFDLKIDGTVVPLPMGVWGGLEVLGIMGVMGVVRWRRGRVVV